MVGKKSIRSTSVRIISLVIGIVVILLLFESAVRLSGYQKPAYNRVLGPPKYYGVIPNSKGWIIKAPVNINSKGLRGKEYSYKKDKGNFRIFVSGSCVTFGHGLALEKTYTKQLESLLNHTRAPGSYEVINGGLPNSNINMCVNFFKDEGIKYEPDLLIFQWEMTIRRSKERKKRRSPWIGLLMDEVIPKMPRELYLTWFLYDKVLSYNRASYSKRKLRKEREEIGFLNEKYSKTGNTWRREKKYFEKLFAFAEKRKTPILVTIFPWMNYLDDNHPFRHIYSNVTKICNEYKVESLDLYNEFNGKDPKNLWFSSRDRHPNEQAHRIISEAVYNKLIQKIFFINKQKIDQ